MEKTSYLPNTAVKLEALLAKWERGITVVVVVCAVVAIVLGIVWLFLRKDVVLFAVLGFGACYLVGKNFWRFRPRRHLIENQRVEIEGGLG